jgi:hypothetical protein
MIMQKVQIVVFGRTALVDEDMVKKMLKKEQLVNRSSALREAIDHDLSPSLLSLINQERQEIARKIINLNRTIRQNVQFI